MLEWGTFICSYIEHSRWKVSSNTSPPPLQHWDWHSRTSWWFCNFTSSLSMLFFKWMYTQWHQGWNIYSDLLYFGLFFFFNQKKLSLGFDILSEEEKSEWKGAQQMPILWNGNWYLIKKLHREHLKWLRRHFPRDRKHKSICSDHNWLGKVFNRERCL